MASSVHSTHAEKSRILVTGATGFIGKHLVGKLSTLTSVRVLVRKTSRIDFLRHYKNVEITFGDLDSDLGLDNALRDIDSVVHCAARTNATTYYEYYQTNTLGTHYLIEAMKRMAVRNILFLSTNAVSGPSESVNPVCEEDRVRPISYYGSTKKRAEDIVKQSGLHYLILRPVAVYGPHDMDMLRYIRLIAQGICPIIGFGDKYLNLIYVEDLIDLMLVCLANHAFDNETFFVHDGQCYEFTNVVHTIAEILGRRARIIRIPRSIAILYSILNEVFIHPAKRLVRRDKIYELACQYWLCSTDRLSKRFGFKPRFTLVQGMEHTLLWYRKHGYLP
jgi:nucleoside-diphosphate-sugar epimerase